MARRGSTQLPEHVPHQATAPPQDPDLLDQLSFEHRQVQRLWSELQLAHRRHLEDVHRPEARYGSVGQRALGRQIVEALARHEAVELERLYPTAGRLVGQEWAEHARSDHAEVRALLDDVDGEDPEDDAIFEVFTLVLTKVLAHFDEEEKIIFPMLRAVGASGELGEPAPEGGAGDAPPEVIDLAAAEREAAEAPVGGGSPRKDKLRRRLLKR
jgi:hemerythrin-like domain-containing protein